MSEPFVWWANRKSRMGLKPSAKAPPHHPNGREWWTSPPTSAPEPAHIEYVAAFHRELMAAKPSRTRNAMIKYVADWMREARRLMHERGETYGQDLQTLDGLMEAANATVSSLIGLLISLGHKDKINERTRAVGDALNARAAQAKRRRAMGPSQGGGHGPQ